MSKNSNVSRRKVLKIIGVVSTIPIVKACSTEFDAVKGDLYATEFDKAVYRLESIILKKAGDNTFVVDKEYLYSPKRDLNFVLSLIEKDNKFYLQMEKVKFISKTKSKTFFSGIENNKTILLNPQRALQQLDEKYHKILKSRMIHLN